MDPVEPVTSYVDHLPEILREDPMLAAIVRAFEAVLVGAVERPLAGLHRYFTPGPGLADGERAPDEFLPWLAGWLGLGLRPEWDGPTRRRLIAAAVELYRLRGTRAGVRLALALYLDDPTAVQIYEFTAPPHFFQVVLAARTSDPVALSRTDRCVRALIEQTKPAHTVYGIQINFPSVAIDDTRTPGAGVFVGVNTTLGSQSFAP